MAPNIVSWQNLLSWNEQTQSWSLSNFMWGGETPKIPVETINLFMTIGDKVVDNIYYADIENNLNGIGQREAEIGIVEGLAKYDKVKIYEVYRGGDILVFEGYLYDFNVFADKIQIIAKDRKNLMYNKLVLSDVSYTNKTISYILNDILSQWNNYTGDNLIFECNNTTLLSKDFKQGDNLFSIIEELTIGLGITWKVVDNKIIAGFILGVDRTQGENYVELIYNKKEVYTNNIISIKSSELSEKFNIIIGKNGNTSILQKMVAPYEPIGVFKTYRDGDLASFVNKDLQDSYIQRRILEIEVKGLDILKIGDRVKVNIENVNSYLDFTGEAFILKETIKYENGMKNKTLEVSNIYTYKQDFFYKYKQIQDNLKFLNIKG